MKSNLHRFPKPVPVYRPAEGERLQDGEQSQIDYDVRIRLEGLAEPESIRDELSYAPNWLPLLVMFVIGLCTGVFITASMLGP